MANNFLPEHFAKVGRIYAAIPKFDFTKLKQSLQVNHGISVPSAEGAVRELVRFLTLKVVSKDFYATMLSPSKRVDIVWHAFLEFPADYVTFCRSILPEAEIAKGVFVIDHNPLGGND
jgi:hypothetical protein